MQTGRTGQRITNDAVAFEFLYRASQLIQFTILEKTKKRSPNINQVLHHSHVIIG